MCEPYPQVGQLHHTPSMYVSGTTAKERQKYCKSQSLGRTGPNQSAFQPEERWAHELPPITELLLKIDGFWRRESQFLYGCVPWLVDHTLVDRPTPMSMWATKTGLSGL